MPKEKNVNDTIKAKGVEISVISAQDKDDYISLTDMAKFKNAESAGFVIQNWLRNRNTIEYIGLWEKLNNPNFNYLEFEAIRQSAGLNRFVLTPKRWISDTNAIGLITKQGKYAATFAHKDIAFKFAAWLSVEFELYVIKDYQRLKESESHQTALDWNVKRILSKVNYKIHTDAVKDNLITDKLTAQERSYIYANEADLFNVILFGKKAWEWKIENPNEKDKNIRDYATIEELLVLANLETTNALLIKQGISIEERADELRKLAKTLLKQIENTKGVKDLKQLHNQIGINAPVDKIDKPK